MVVTSVYWLFFAVSISVLSIQSADSRKMAYGLVQRPAGLYSGSSASTAAAKTSSTSTEKSKLEANETAISTQTEQPLDINESISVSKITQSNVALNDDTETDGSKYTENDILPWLMQSAANPPYIPKSTKSKPVKASHQYQVTEDSEVDATSNNKQIHGNNHDHKGEKNDGSEKTAGAKSNHHKEEKKKGKEGKEGGEKKYAKKGGKKGGYEEKKKQVDKFGKSKKKKKTGEYKIEKKQKKHSSKKGFNDKYRYDKEDKVKKFWHSHHEKGVFRKFGRKKSIKHKEDEAKKKKKKKKVKKTSKKSKKQDKKEKKEGHKEESGFQSEKDKKDSYHHESEYGKNKKSKSSKEKKKKKKKKKT